MTSDTQNDSGSHCPFVRPLSGTADCLQIDLLDSVDIETNRGTWCDEISEAVKCAYGEQAGLTADRFHVPVRVESGSLWIEVLCTLSSTITILASLSSARRELKQVRNALKHVSISVALRTIGRYAKFELISHTQESGVLDSLVERHASGETSLGELIGETVKICDTLNEQENLTEILHNVDGYFELLATELDGPDTKKRAVVTHKQPQIVEQPKRAIRLSE